MQPLAEFVMNSGRSVPAYAATRTLSSAETPALELTTPSWVSCRPIPHLRESIHAMLSRGDKIRVQKPELQDLETPINFTFLAAQKPISVKSRSCKFQLDELIS